MSAWSPKKISNCPRSRALSGAPSSARKGSSTTTTTICAAATASGACRSTPKATRCRTRLQPTPPTAGYSLKTTLDFGLQREGEKALLEGIENARAGGKPATAGAFVAMNPLNGEVLAIGSWPTFDPNKFAKPLTEAEYGQLKGKTGPTGKKSSPRR